MQNKLILQSIHDLVLIKTRNELSEWIDKNMIGPCTPSSLFVAVCRMQKECSIITYYITPSFPKYLIRAFDTKDPIFSPPLLRESHDAKYPVILDLQQGTQQNAFWTPLFIQHGFSVVAVASEMDPREEYLTYMCATDPMDNGVPAQPALFQKKLAILSPLLSKILISLERETAQHENDVLLQRLTPREREVLEWVAKGKTNWEISQILGLAHPTIKNHVQKILLKLHLSDRTQAASILHKIPTQIGAPAAF